MVIRNRHSEIEHEQNGHDCTSEVGISHSAEYRVVEIVPLNKIDLVVLEESIYTKG